ncbi:hypothetical protein V1507DRAFT_440933 [Lipomyces tetrasporus]
MATSSQTISSGAVLGAGHQAQQQEDDLLMVRSLPPSMENRLRVAANRATRANSRNVTVSADGNTDSKTVPTLMSSSVLQTGKQIQMSRNRLCGFLLVVDSSLLSRGPDDDFSFPKLSGEDNYLSWKQNILLPLRAFQLADALSYEDSVADFSEEKRQKNDNALSAMLVNMEASYQKLYMKHEKAREVCGDKELNHYGILKPLLLPTFHLSHIWTVGERRRYLVRADPAGGSGNIPRARREHSTKYDSGPFAIFCK